MNEPVLHIATPQDSRAIQRAAAEAAAPGMEHEAESAARRDQPPGLHLRTMHPTDRQPLREALAADGAEMIAPTHVLERDGQIVGYGSAGFVRLLAGWTAPAVNDATSAAALQDLEQAAANAGARLVLVACSNDCRFKRLMKQQGYREGSKQVTLYFKKVS